MRISLVILCGGMIVMLVRAVRVSIDVAAALMMAERHALPRRHRGDALRRDNGGQQQHG